MVEGVAVGRANKLEPYARGRLRGVRADGCSSDGTTRYLASLAVEASTRGHVTVHASGDGRGEGMTRADWQLYGPHVLRFGNDSTTGTGRGGGGGKVEGGGDGRGIGCVWTDKLEMVNTALASIHEPCVLFQVTRL